MHRAGTQCWKSSWWAIVSGTVSKGLAYIDAIFLKERRPDVTRKLRYVRSGLSKLLEGTADAAFVMTLEGEICFWNAAAERLFCYKATDVLNGTCDEVLQGRGALDTLVYSGDSSLQRCAVHTELIPAFDPKLPPAPGYGSG